VLPLDEPASSKVIAIEKKGDQYRVIVQISTKYRGSFNTLAFGEIKPYSGSLKDGRLDLIYYRDPGLNVGDPFPVFILRGRKFSWPPPDCFHVRDKNTGVFSCSYAQQKRSFEVNPVSPTSGRQ
jgi:hypothetical protein